jgi:GAF domain-containing protein
MIDAEKKSGRYERVYDQLLDLLDSNHDRVAAMATIVAILHHKFKYFFWTGFYLLTDGELIVGPYQGSLACIKLKKDTGVCWAGINRKRTVVVPNVHEFPGHIACDSRSNSEIVVPLRDKTGKITGVLDVDSTEFNAFDEADKEGLERIVALLS